MGFPDGAGWGGGGRWRSCAAGFEEILEVIKVISQERESEFFVEQIFDVPVLQVLEEIVEEILEVIKVIPQEWVSEFFVEQVRTSLKLCDYSLERIQHRTVGETADIPVPCSGAYC